MTDAVAAEIVHGALPDTRSFAMVAVGNSKSLSILRLRSAAPSHYRLGRYREALAQGRVRRTPTSYFFAGFTGEF